ncbi:MAG: phosphatidate cytidylyltransferase, partial [Acidimicrobiales bacterium]
HWTDPPTGEVPLIRPTSPGGSEPAPSPGVPAGPDEDDMRVWADLPRREPNWRDRDADWDDLGYDPAELAEDVRLGALDESRRAEDPYSFEGLDEPAGTGEPGAGGPGQTDVLAGQSRTGGHEEWTENGEEDQVVAVRGRAGRLGGRGLGPPDGEPDRGRLGWVRIATGVGLGILTLVLFEVGPVASLALDTFVLTFAAAELFAVLRRAGYRPATLPGLVGTVCIVVAAYMKGEAALGVVVVLFVVVAFFWYLFGVEKGRPTVNLAATVLGFLWVGFLGSYAGLLLSPSLFPHRHGIAFLLGAAVATVAYDVGALIVGSRLGRRPLAPSISPNKTWEGLIGGAVFCLIITTLVVGQIHPWGHKSALALGVVVSVVAPLGDLAESMVKRDLGVKDMGSILPGHGGFFDRIDALLFVLPATFYLVRVLNIG